MSKITSEHLGRGAYVYIRQSTADQLLHNHESRRRQYGLADRARTLGWSTVEVIDDDLGRSGGGIARPGFERLIAAICAGTSTVPRLCNTFAASPSTPFIINQRGLRGMKKSRIKKATAGKAWTPSFQRHSVSPKPSVPMPKFETNASNTPITMFN